MMKPTTLLTPKVFASVFSKQFQALDCLLKCIFPNLELTLEELFTYEQKTIYPESDDGMECSIIIYAKDKAGKLYDICLVIANEEYHNEQAASRAECLLLCGRYNKYDNVEVYTIMLSNKNLLNIGPQEPVGNIDWICKETGTQLTGGDHIIYLNGAYNDESTEIGKLIHDLKESNPDNMYLLELRRALKNYTPFPGPDKI